MIVHQGVSLGSVISEKRCRNKLAVKVDMENLIENNLQPDWPLGHFRTVTFGDWRSPLKDLAALSGLAFFDEDKAYGWHPRRQGADRAVDLLWRDDRRSAGGAAGRGGEERSR